MFYIECFMVTNMENQVLGDVHIGKYTYRLDEYSIFKPRNARTEHAWREFLDTLEVAGLENVPGYTEVLFENDDSHVVRRVFNLGTDHNGVVRYFRRCGCLLCLTWLLGSSDLHSENVIACEDKPVLVDLETLLSGTEKRQTEMHDQSIAGSVFRTHLLPYFSGICDVSGLTGDDDNNIPQVDNKPVYAQNYLEYLIEGFRVACDFIMQNREFVCNELYRFDDCRFRVILRPTSVYLALFDVIKEKNDRSLANLMRLLRIAYEHDIDPDRINKAAIVLKSEFFALSKGWIPLFYTYGNNNGLYCDYSQLGDSTGDCLAMPDFLRKSPVETAISRIRSLTTSEEKKQEKIIRMIFHCKEHQTDTEPVYDWRERFLNSLYMDRIPQLPSGYITLANDGTGALWTSIGWGLYDGVAGVLCALAALGQENSILFKELYKQLTDALLSLKFKTPLTKAACSLSDGVAGIIAALIHITDLTGKDIYRSDAESLLGCFEPRLLGEAQPDLLSGLSGLCLQLPKLPCRQSTQLAEILISALESADTDLTGAGHGKAGLSLALGALQKTLHTSELDNRILALINEENALYDVEKSNWPDLRIPGKRGFMGGWCSGAPGIGMCRRRLMQYTDNDEIIAICKSDIQRVTLYLKNCRELRRDTLCCGNASRLMSGTYIGYKMTELEHKLTRSTSSDASKLYHAVNTADHNISLMQGMAGIGYALAMSRNEHCGEMLL